MDNKTVIDVIYLDLHKLFDAVPHNNLVSELEQQVDHLVVKEYAV